MGFSRPVSPLKEVSNSLASPTIISAAAADGADFNDTPFNTVSVSATSAKVSEMETLTDPAGVQLGNEPALAGSVLTQSHEVFLGTVALIVGSSVGTTVFNLGRNGTPGSTVTFNNGDDMDTSGTDRGGTGQSYIGVGTSVSQITVEVGVPEPASVAIIGAVSVIGLLGRRKRLGNNY
jgi:hypothetical protein